MGCGCGRRGSVPRRKTLRPSVGPKSVQGGVSAGSTPAQLRALGIAQSQSLKESGKMDEQRRRVEKLRREAIRKKLNK